MDDNNLNKTTNKVGETIVMRCQSEGEPSPEMSFKKQGAAQPYVPGVQPVRALGR